MNKKEIEQKMELIARIKRDIAYHKEKIDNLEFQLSFFNEKA